MPRLDILEEDEVARAWVAARIKTEMAAVIRTSLILGPLGGLLAIFGVSRMGDGELPWGFVVPVILVPSSIGIMIWLLVYLSCAARNRWELSAEGIKMRGSNVTSIRWSRIEKMRFRTLDDLPGYTSVVIQGKPRFGIFKPLVAGITVKAPEDELRKLLVENRR